VLLELASCGLEHGSIDQDDLAPRHRRHRRRWLRRRWRCHRVGHKYRYTLGSTYCDRWDTSSQEQARSDSNHKCGSGPAAPFRRAIDCGNPRIAEATVQDQADRPSRRARLGAALA
jgi:hypothetical protein